MSTSVWIPRVIRCTDINLVVVQKIHYWQASKVPVTIQSVGQSLPVATQMYQKVGVVPCQLVKKQLVFSQFVIWSTSQLINTNSFAVKSFTNTIQQPTRLLHKFESNSCNMGNRFSQVQSQEGKMQVKKWKNKCTQWAIWMLGETVLEKSLTKWELIPNSFTKQLNCFCCLANALK